MPWKESNVMSLRTEFVLRAVHKQRRFGALCREYGISPKTGYKWMRRFIAHGVADLDDRPRRPKTNPRQLGHDEACRLVRIKLAQSDFGPKKVHEVYALAYPHLKPPSLSTVKRILAKAGLVKKRRPRRHDQCGRIQKPVNAQAPNDLWTVDFKGWWYSADRKKIEPLTVRDAYSRYVLHAQPLRAATNDEAQLRFQRLFETYGLPKAIRSDNGPPFACTASPLGLTRLSAWWVALGINLDRIRPGHPEDNGGHERMHRDIPMELEGGGRGDFRAHQAALEAWREKFNHRRPHEALGMRFPADVYVKSPRKYDPTAVELKYPAEYLTRRVGRTGAIRIANWRIHISLAVSGWDVGLKPTAPGQYTVWFGPLCLGQIDLATRTFTPAR